MLFQLLDGKLPMDLSNIIVSYLSYNDIIIFLPEIHRIYTENVDEYNLIVPYYPFRHTVWEWRLDTFHNPGIRMRAHSVLGDTHDTYPWVIGRFLPPTHGKCANGFRDILRNELVAIDDLDFILTHWNQDLFAHMASEVMNKDVVDCLRSGCGIVLGLILRSVMDGVLSNLKGWTIIALDDYDNDHFKRCVYTETDNLFPSED